MCKSLLLGNGINMYLAVEGFSQNDIYNRFTNSLNNSSLLYETLFGVNVTEDIIKKIFQNKENIGIESLAIYVYDYVKDNALENKSINMQMRLLDAIICSAITAIFCDGNKILGDMYAKSKMLNIEKYENVFTLNYFEFWDVNNVCKYLHGKIELERFACNEKPMLFYSEERYIGFKEYRDKINELIKQFNVCELYTRDIIFSPEFHQKSEMFELGNYPSELLFPADDLFLNETKELYTELDNVKNIDVFGLSPYGDEELINKLNGMEMVTVYVYDKDNNAEADKWNERLNCNYIIKDSKEISCN
ncbi:MAG: hypothetical protein GX913_01010 [Clostridiales bacterium]|nr:hypothetical protein [Clostridiales bacterium]